MGWCWWGSGLCTGRVCLNVVTRSHQLLAILLSCRSGDIPAQSKLSELRRGAFGQGLAEMLDSSISEAIEAQVELLGKRGSCGEGVGGRLRQG